MTVYDEVEWYPFAGWNSHAPSGSSTYTIERTLESDESGRLAEVVFTDGTNDYDGISYEYALDGNPKSSLNNYYTPAKDLAHDSLSRLTRGRDGTFSYDDAGNRLSGPGGNLTYPDDTENKWSSAEGGSIDYTFDSAGRVVLRDPGTPYRLEYNEEGWLDSIEENDEGSKQTDYTRDYRGLRVEKAGWGGSGVYSYDPQGRLIGWEGPASYVVECTEWAFPNRITHWETHTPYETYVYLGNKRVAIVKSHYESGNSSCGTTGFYYIDDTYHLINDKMGQSIGIRRASDWKSVWRADLDEWGNPISINEDPDSLGAYTYNLRLPGQMALTQKEGGGSLNEGGLVENWHRVYDSVTGRYMRVDPLMRDEASYRYGASKPLVYVDPKGLDVVYRVDPRSKSVEFIIDRWDECCRPKGGFYGHFGSANAANNQPHMANFLSYPTSDQLPKLDPLSSQTGWELQCTTCEGDKAMIDFLREHQLDPNGPIYWDEGGFPTFNFETFRDAVLAAGKAQPCLKYGERRREGDSSEGGCPAISCAGF